MRFENKTVILRNGKQCLLRSPEPSDAEALIEYLRQTSAETSNLIRYEDEIKIALAEEETYIRSVCDEPDSCMVSAWVDGELAGNSGLNPIMRLDRLRHRAQFGISLKQKFWHLGIGSALVKACIEAACVMGYEQVELEVVAANSRAIELYERHGFVTYGRRPRGMKFRDGGYSDELLMVLRL